MITERLLNPIKSRIRLMIGRAVITACGGKVVDLDLLAGESRNDVDFMQHFGFSSKPKGDTSAIALFVGGSRDNGVVIASRGEDSDMEVDLSAGEVAVHSPFGNSVILKSSGDIEIMTKNGIGTVKVNGNIEATMQVTAMSELAPVKLSTHTHATAVGPTAPPTPGT